MSETVNLSEISMNSEATAIASENEAASNMHNTPALSENLLDSETAAIAPEVEINFLPSLNLTEALDASNSVLVGEDGIPKITFRDLKFEDLEQYKRLLKEFPQGFVGILFKEICKNETGEFYAHGAFIDDEMAGIIIGIRDYAKIRQFTDIEIGLAAMTSKNLSHIITVIVDPKFRRNEIGAKLLEGFMKFVGNSTAKFLLIPHQNIIAQQFFESQNFGALSTLRKFYNEFEDALLFVDKDSNRE